jgi:hypothetical protein
MNWNGIRDAYGKHLGHFVVSRAAGTEAAPFFLLEFRLPDARCGPWS